MTVGEFQARYHDFSTTLKAEAEAEAAKVNAEGIGGGRKAVVFPIGREYCLLLDTAASYLASYPPDYWDRP
jgi:hypothetical protein